MKRTLSILTLVLLILLAACRQGSSVGTAENASVEYASSKHQTTLKITGKTIKDRFLPPKGYQREKTDSSSFAHYLRNLPLYPSERLVHYYNGETKPNTGVYAAVIALPIGNRDLHQCADAIMRLRAEYHYQEQQYDKIHFNFTNGFRVDYKEWMQGKRIVVNGNVVSWRQKTQAANNPKIFWKYLETIFSYAGTASLAKEMKSKSMTDLAIGDVFIQGGFPGHAIIVVDMAVHPTSNEKVFLLAQSYMPAQELQLLQNPNNSGLNPWYHLDATKKLITPEWVFENTDVKQFTP